MKFIGGIFGGALLWLAGWEMISGMILGMVGLGFLMIGGFFFELSLILAVESGLSWECLILIGPLILFGISAYFFKLSFSRLDSDKAKRRLVSRKEFEDAVKYLRSQGYSEEQIISIATGKAGARA